MVRHHQGSHFHARARVASGDIAQNYLFEPLSQAPEQAVKANAVRFSGADGGGAMKS